MGAATARLAMEPQLVQAPSGPAPLDVLVIDDEKNIRSALRVCLETVGVQVVEVANADAARLAAKRQRFDLAFLDLRLGDANGLTLIPTLLGASPLIDIIVITAHGTVENAVEAIQLGAREVVQKPFSPAQIRELVDKVRNRIALQGQLRMLRGNLDGFAPDVDFESRSPRVRSLLAMLARAAQRDVPVLLRGENGTGKSVLARQMHALSRRAARPFVVVNCPTLSEELLASELFGHVRGAFTGAVRDQPGRVESAEGGTLFLDEIGEMPPSLQAKLLRFLQDHKFERVGDTQTRTADVRIVAATNRKLDEEVAAGRFREDLLFRLNTFELEVPSLRDRPEDILPLANRFLAFLALSENAARCELTQAAGSALRSYQWPGNIRELRNTMERAAILATGTRIDVDLLSERIRGRVTSPQVGGDFTLEQIEREHIERILARSPTGEEAARMLGIDTSTLWRKRKRWEEGHG
jgi:NtrC-family two-component system response regulator AlgB